MAQIVARLGQLHWTIKNEWIKNQKNTKQSILKKPLPGFGSVAISWKGRTFRIRTDTTLCAALNLATVCAPAVWRLHKKKHRIGTIVLTSSEWKVEANPGYCIFGPYLWRLRGSEQTLSRADLSLVLRAALNRRKQSIERLEAAAKADQLPNRRRRSSIPEQVRMLVWRRDAGRCVECGSQERLEYDHIIPVIKGGANTARNIQLLCEVCNRSKGARQ